MKKSMLAEKECAGIMRALGDETRLGIIESLLVEQKCVSDLVRALGRPQPHVSHHLRILRQAGLVEGIREGQHIFYRVLPSIHRQLRNGPRQAIDLGCCRITFPHTYLLSHPRTKATHSARSES